MLAIAHTLDGVGQAEAARLADLHDRPLSGRSEWLSEGTLKAIILVGPNSKRHGCVEWSLRRLNLSKQKTRPRHPQSDAKAQADFPKRAARSLESLTPCAS